MALASKCYQLFAANPAQRTTPMYININGGRDLSSESCAKILGDFFVEVWLESLFIGDIGIFRDPGCLLSHQFGTTTREVGHEDGCVRGAWMP